MVLNTSPANQRLLAVRRNDQLKKPTAAELYVKGLLDKAGVKYLFQKGFFNANRHYIVDFYIKSQRRLCLEIDGGYHFTPEQMAYDQRRDAFLRDVRGFRVVRIRNEDAVRMTMADLMTAIR